MAKSIFLAVALVIAFASMERADALSCYECFHSEIGESGSEKSCKSGKKPDSDLKTDCGGSTAFLDNLPESFGPFAEAYNNASGIAASGNKQYSFACGKIVVGSVGTVRFCEIKSSGVEDKCDEGTVRDFAVGTGIWQSYAVYFSNYGYSSNQFTGCICSGDNCNSGFSIKFSFTLVFSSVLTLAFVKH